MSVKWRIFIDNNRKIALGMKVKRDGELWTPVIVATSNQSDPMRLDRVTKPLRRQMEVTDTKVTLTTQHVKCVLPLTLEGRTVIVNGTTLSEDQDLRAVPNYGKRGTWYKIVPR